MHSVYGRTSFTIIPFYLFSVEIDWIIKMKYVDHKTVLNYVLGY